VLGEYWNNARPVSPEGLKGTSEFDAGAEAGVPKTGGYDQDDDVGLVKFVTQLLLPFARHYLTIVEGTNATGLPQRAEMLQQQVAPRPILMSVRYEDAHSSR
jgi:hypothetical protein